MEQSNVKINGFLFLSALKNSETGQEESLQLPMYTAKYKFHVLHNYFSLWYFNNYSEQNIDLHTVE